MNHNTTALRPQLTQTIFDLLNEGRSVNLYGEEGQGLNRLVDDLAKLLPNSVKLTRLSMRSYAHSYDSFSTALCRELGIERPKNEHMTVAATVNQFLDKPNSPPLWLVIEHFDRLTEKPLHNQSVDTKGYDRAFLDHLNSFRNNPKIHLLFTSARKITTQALYVGGARVNGSRLELSQYKLLIGLSNTDIKAEMARRAHFDTTNYWESPEGMVLLGEINRHPQAYQFMDFVADQLESSETTDLKNFEKILAKWKRDFDQINAPTIDKRIGHLEIWSSKFLERTNRLLGISKIWRTINTTFGKIFLILSAIGTVWWNWGEKIWQFIAALWQK